MKTIAIIAVAIGLAFGALAQGATTVTLRIQPIYDTNKMAGLNTNDYSTNFQWLVYRSTTAANPSNSPSSYSLFTNYPGNFFIASQGFGPWSDRVTVAGNVGFWVFQSTNISNGGASPFSLPYPMLLDPLPGQVGISR